MPGKKPLWPVHLKPLPDEVLTSWLLRLASAYGTTLKNFIRQVAPHPSTTGHNLDHGLALPLERVLSEGVGISLQRIRSHVLGAPDKDSTTPPPRADREWLLGPAKGRGMSSLPGQTYCPICLAEDTTPYLRRRWRRYYITLCDVHGTALLDRCAFCNTSVNQRWAGYASLAARLAAPVTLCTHCGRDLRGAADIARQRHGEPEDLAAMHFLMETVRTGWAVRQGQEPIRANLYLPVVIGLCAEEIGANVEGLVVRAGGPQGTELPDAIRGFVQPRRRRDRIRSIHWLLEDWPERFVEICWLAEIPPVRLLYAIGPPVPFWYWSVVAENVYDLNFERDPRELEWMAQMRKAASAAQARARAQARKTAQQGASDTATTLRPLLWPSTNDEFFTYFRADLQPVLRAAGRFRYAMRYRYSPRGRP